MPEDQTPEELLERVNDLFTGAARTMFPKRSPALGSVAFNFTLAQWKCLRALSRSDNCTMSELSQYLDVAPSTATELVDRLVRVKMVERVSDPTDRRVIRLRVAPEGRELLAEHGQQRLAVLRQSLDRLNGEQRTELVRALETLQDLLVAVRRED